ncbi:DUF7079 family protein [Deinococcus sp.]|uniref:DUF7079 family protein n=1 Tax=Deinococcus sp. TaxID=47478 RepID=UPI003CC62387
MTVASVTWVPWTAPELAQRREVWDTLSDLYLDTDTRPDLPRMARVLAESGLSEAELNTIWRQEVTPALVHNLSVPTGEWAYFPLEWLEGRIVRRQRYVQQHQVQRLMRWPSLTRWLSRAWPNELEPYFQTVLTLRGELLSLPEPERPARANLWQWIASAYFWPETPVFMPLPPDTEHPEDVFAQLESHLRPLLNAEDARKMPLEQRRAHVLKLIRGDA